MKEYARCNEYANDQKRKRKRKKRKKAELFDSGYQRFFIIIIVRLLTEEKAHDFMVLSQTKVLDKTR